MEQLKTYAVPLVALVLLLLWFFVVRPMIPEPAASEADTPGQGQGQDAGEEPATERAPQ